MPLAFVATWMQLADVQLLLQCPVVLFCQAHLQLLHPQPEELPGAVMIHEPDLALLKFVELPLPIYPTYPGFSVDPSYPPENPHLMSSVILWSVTVVDAHNSFIQIIDEGIDHLDNF